MELKIRVPRKTYGPKKEAVEMGQRKLHNEEHYYYYYYTTTLHGFLVLCTGSFQAFLKNLPGFNASGHFSILRDSVASLTLNTPSPSPRNYGGSRIFCQSFSLSEMFLFDGAGNSPLLLYFTALHLTYGPSR
jgi:hypothetical protein